MSAPQEPTTKKFGKGERSIPHPAQQASKYYPAEDEQQAKKVRKAIRPAKPRASLQPGTVLILLAGRFRGKRVVLLKHLPQGVLLVTGPFKINGVPLRRVNARYVIATSTKVDLSGLDQGVVEKVGSDSYFAREKKDKKAGEEAFFKQGEKPEPKKVAGHRAEDQRSVDKAILANIKKSDPFLLSYLGSTFSLRKGDKPHAMVF
ncbi:60S ribosomal protein eL6 [Phyllosticta citribraziliensis]|uniref:60S ribosomal protein L6 n=1 Tax=Phyllosticta citribraziliensis TaxID=989973 RepID=A0ABR1LV34_9PEZI